MKKKWKIAGIVFFCVVVCVIGIFMRKEKRAEDVTDVGELAAAEDLGNEKTGIILELEQEESGQDIKKLTFHLKNKTEEPMGYKYEIVIDRKIDGVWYQWGVSGNGYEIAHGIDAGSEEVLTFPLECGSLADGDYLIDYRGKEAIMDGTDHIEGDADIAIILFPGEYRVRLRGEPFEENVEAVCNFSFIA